MNNNQGMVSCAVGCWLVALLGGVLAAVLLALLGGWTFVQAVFAGIVVAGVAGALLSWIMCKPLPPLGSAHAGETTDAAAAKAEAARADAEARSAEAAAAATASDPGTAAAATAPVAVATKPAAKTEAPKPAAKAKAAPKAKAEPKPKATAKPKAEPAPADDGAGKKPATLSAAREGGPDDLKQIKGVGPKMEAMLHSMGFYHFDQVAGWSADEVAWVDQNLEGFKGRVSRDKWVDQAKTLAAGGTTEFSAKVKKGDVY